jgi:hypothetical protein
MPKNSKAKWFRPSSVNYYSIIPINWKGYVTILLFILLTIGNIVCFAHHIYMLLIQIILIILIVIFGTIVYKKGGEPDNSVLTNNGIILISCII